MEDIDSNKRARIAGGEGGEDRLSDLPDNVLQHILSFLGDTKFAVRTSVLSKRWKDVWTCVPALNLTSESFTRVSSFAPFVNRVLSRRNPGCKLGKVSFFRRLKFDSSLTHKVTDYALARGANHLIVEAGSDWRDSDPPLPAPLSFNCPSLTNLELCGFDIPGPVGFRLVTTLSLRGCKLSYGDNSGECFDPFAKFPNLINLTLHACEIGSFKVLKISGDKMLNLSMIMMYYGSSCLYPGCKLEIYAPKLTFFSYKRSDAVAVSDINLPSLQYSYVHVPLPSELAKPFPLPKKKYLKRLEEHRNSTYHSLFNLLQGLCNAQHLTLSYSTITTMDVAPHMSLNRPSPFHRLKSLKVVINWRDICASVPLNVMKDLLSGSSCAEDMCV